MKKLTTVICASVMAVTLSVNAGAAISIGQMIPENPTISEESKEYIPEPEKNLIVVKKIKAENYADIYEAVTEEEKKTVEDTIEKINEYNDEKSTLTIQDTMKAFDVKVDEEVLTTDGETTVKPSEYKALMPEFVDLVLENQDTKALSHTLAKEGKIEVTFILEQAKELDEQKALDDLLIMQVDPKTGEVYFIKIKAYDPKTGKITADFPCLGPFTVLTKGEVPQAALEKLNEAEPETTTEAQ